MLHHNLETESRTKNHGDSIQNHFAKTETINVSDKKLFSDHTKDGKASFESADQKNEKKNQIMTARSFSRYKRKSNNNQNVVR